MIKKALPLLCAAAVLMMPACTYRPYHPAKSDREWAIDHQACEVSVRSLIRDDPAGYDEFDEMRMIKECMEKKGWTWQQVRWFHLRGPDAE